MEIDNAYVYSMGIGSEEEPTSCASYQNGQWYILMVVNAIVIIQKVQY